MNEKIDLKTLSDKIIDDDKARKITGGQKLALCIHCKCTTWSGDDAVAENTTEVATV